MAGFDWEKFGQDIVTATKSHIDKSLEPILRRLDALESIPAPKDGKDADPIDMDAVRSMITAAVAADDMVQMIDVIADKAVAKYVEFIPAPKDGKDADPVDMDVVRSMIVEECKDIRAGLESTLGPEMQIALSVMVKEAVEAIPVPVAPELPDIDGMVRSAVAEIPVPVAPELPDIDGMVRSAVASVEVIHGRDGKDADPVDMDAVNERVDAALNEGLRAYAQAVADIPIPKDGKSVTVDEIKPLIDEAVTRAVSAIPVPKDGKDGADMVSAIIGKDEHLHITLSTGKTIDVGRVVGWDGVDCDFAKVQEQIAADIKTLFDAQPKPRDGFGFDDLSVEYDGERTITLAFQRGEHRKEFPIVMPVILDRGVFVEGKTYDRGDSVTWAGSRWIAQKDGVTVKPDDHKGDWLLSVKRGPAGKNVTDRAPRPNVPVKLGAN